MFGKLARLGVFLGGFSLFLAIITVWVLLLRNPQIIALNASAAAPDLVPFPNATAHAVESRSIAETMVHYAPLANAVGLLLAGGAAFAFFIGVQIHQRRDQWLGSFRAIYAEFWSDKDVAYVRTIIVSTVCYNEILRPVLDKRNCSEDNMLSLSENETIEKIDRFCAIMVRVTSFAATLRRPDEYDLWEKLFYDFWVNKVEPREELRTYIGEHWKELKPTRPTRGRGLFGSA